MSTTCTSRLEGRGTERCVARLVVDAHVIQAHFAHFVEITLLSRVDSRRHRSHRAES